MGRSRLLCSGRHSYADLDSKYVMRRSRQFRITADVTMQIYVVDPIEAPSKMLAHTVKGKLIHKAVVRDEADNPISASVFLNLPR